MIVEHLWKKGRGNKTALGKENSREKIDRGREGRKIGEKGKERQ
jgi:hypothetical protein